MMNTGISKKVPGKTMLLIALGILFMRPALSYGQPAAGLTIDSCYAMASRNYPLIKQYDLIEKSKEYTIANANKAWLPHVSITAIGAYIISGLPSITMPNSPPPEKKDFQFIGIGQLNQTIWDGGATRTQKEVAEATAEADKATVDISMYDIRERVNQLFFGILVIDEQLKQLEILMENLNRSLRSVKLTLENGLTYQSDVDEVKAELLNAGQRKIEFSFARKGYVDMLAFMTGTPLAETVQLAKPLVLETYASLTNKRHELNLYSKQLLLIEASSSIDKVALMPKFGVMAAGILIEPGMSFGTETMNTLALAGISMSWNTSGLYKFRTNKKINQVKLDKINNQQEIFLFNNALQLKQGSNEIEKQKEIIKNDDEIVSLKIRIRNAYQLKYDNGLCSMNDLITSINKESEAKCNHALHNVQLLLSLYNYKTKTGN
jgi:outer membrane protein TolC